MVSDIATFKFDMDASAQYVRYGIGLDSRWGMELHYLDYSSKYNVNYTSEGELISQKINSTATIPGVKVGTIMGSPEFSLGLTFDINFIRSRIAGLEEGQGKPTDNQQTTILGIAAGTGSADGLIELGLEFDPISDYEDYSDYDEDSPVPLKLSFIAEHRIGDIILGYKGMYYRGPYIDLDQFIQDQLIYSNSSEDSRLEHVFNFTFGKGDGFTFGGSYSYSNTKTKQFSSILESENKHETKTKAQSFGVRLGYVY